jgi:hypothetical protein
MIGWSRNVSLAVAVVLSDQQRASAADYAAIAMLAGDEPRPCSA